MSKASNMGTAAAVILPLLVTFVGFAVVAAETQTLGAGNRSSPIGVKPSKLKAAAQKVMMMNHVISAFKDGVKPGGKAGVRSAKDRQDIVDKMVGAYNTNHSRGNVLRVTDILDVTKQIVRGTK